MKIKGTRGNERSDCCIKSECKRFIRERNKEMKRKKKGLVRVKMSRSAHNGQIAVLVPPERPDREFLAVLRVLAIAKDNSPAAIGTSPRVPSRLIRDGRWRIWRRLGRRGEREAMYRKGRRQRRRLAGGGRGDGVRVNQADSWRHGIGSLFSIRCGGLGYRALLFHVRCT